MRAVVAYVPAALAPTGGPPRKPGCRQAVSGDALRLALRHANCTSALQSVVPHSRSHVNRYQETFMGKYVLGWFLGVPVVVLVIIYLIFH